MSVGQPGGHANDEVVHWIRDAASSLQVSRDLRHRVLDGAHRKRREDHAWQKAFFVCLLATLLFAAIGWWANHLPTSQLVFFESSQWSTDLSRIGPADDRARHEVLSWSGWTSLRTDGIAGPQDLTTMLEKLRRARGDG